MSTLDDVARMRLISQRLIQPLNTPTDAVRHMTCTQGQDLPGSTSSIALRTASRSLAQVRDAYDSGSIVRSWPMRGTLFAVAAEDLGWMLQLTGAKIIRSTSRRRAQLGLSDAHLELAEQVARDALSVGPLTRTELMRAWAEGVTP
ncbi:winged helix DNA-binding domain-containing protein [Ornithinimicrobium sp. INDO-MA30-4]|uniref:winged helix DNA-binding domain-containing protein n=1 Tax=Ornithinimicrobium sp. INDO-MA30-4 TaxID=2908651 RepID=UPI0021A2FF7F|nr:winged helix DNA-binding domain-containing protein [Ornithinimicrobium sp. INDO-MA30-4]